jgi:hypothetical protein
MQPDQGLVLLNVSLTKHNVVCPVGIRISGLFHIPLLYQNSLSLSSFDTLILILILILYNTFLSADCSGIESSSQKRMFLIQAFS